MNLKIVLKLGCTKLLRWIWWRSYFYFRFIVQSILFLAALEVRGARHPPANKNEIMKKMWFCVIWHAYDWWLTQFSLRKMVHNDGAQSVAHHIDGGTESIATRKQKHFAVTREIRFLFANFVFKFKTHDSSTALSWHWNLQQPVDSDNDCDIFSRQADGVEHHDHSNQASLWNASGTDGSGSCGYAAKSSTMNFMKIFWSELLVKFE